MTTGRINQVCARARSPRHIWARLTRATHSFPFPLVSIPLFLHALFRRPSGHVRSRAAHIPPGFGRAPLFPVTLEMQPLGLPRLAARTCRQDTGSACVPVRGLLPYSVMQGGPRYTCIDCVCLVLDSQPTSPLYIDSAYLLAFISHRPINTRLEWGFSLGSPCTFWSETC